MSYERRFKGACKTGNLIALAVTAWSASLSAQQAAHRVLEEIVVTAEKRSASLQNTPIAVTALQSEAIERGNITDLGDVQLVAPSLVFSQIGGASQISIRGVGTDSPTEGGVSLFVDGVFQARTYLQNGTFFDLERIEVLRGPQGTLYGRNSTGGSINLITRLPSFEPEAKASVLLGQYDQIETQIGGSMPLIDDVLAVRGSVSYSENDGWIDNIARNEDLGGQEDLSARASLLWQPSDDLQVVLRGAWQELESDGPVYIFTGLYPVAPLNQSPVDPAGFLDDPNPAFGGLSLADIFGLDVPSPGTANFDRDRTFQDDKTSNILDYASLSGTVSWDINPTLSLKSITAWVRSEQTRTEDVDGTDIPFFRGVTLPRDSEQFTQEFNLSGQALDDRLDWIVGTFYFNEDYSSINEYELPALQTTFEAAFGLLAIGMPLPPGSLAAFGVHRDGVTPDAVPFIDFAQQTDTESIAAFGQATWHYSDRLRLTAGLRYTDDTRDVVTTVASNIVPTTCLKQKSSASWDATTYKLGVDWDLSDNAMVYANHSTGFKAGGFNAGSCSNEYDPEFVNAFEIGLKSRFFDNRVELNGAAFYYDYDDMQARQIVNNATTITNAAKAEMYGLELEAVVLAPWGFTLDGGLMLLHAENEEYTNRDPLNPSLGIQDLAGKDLLRAPNIKANLGIQYDLEMQKGTSLSFRYEVAHTDNMYYDVFNNKVAEQEAFTVSNVRVTWDAGNIIPNLEVQAFVENLTDEEYVEAHLAGSTWGGVISHFANPRWAGLVARYSW